MVLPRRQSHSGAVAATAPQGCYCKCSHQRCGHSGQTPVPRTADGGALYVLRQLRTGERGRCGALRPVRCPADWPATTIATCPATDVSPAAAGSAYTPTTKVLCADVTATTALCPDTADAVHGMGARPALGLSKRMAAAWCRACSAAAYPADARPSSPERRRPSPSVSGRRPHRPRHCHPGVPLPLRGQMRQTGPV